MTGYIIISNYDNGEEVYAEKILKNFSARKAEDEFNKKIVSCLNWGPDDLYNLMLVKIKENIDLPANYLEQLKEGDLIDDPNIIELFEKWSVVDDTPGEYIGEIFKFAKENNIEKLDYETIANILHINLDIVKEKLDLDGFNEKLNIYYGYDYE